MTYQFKLYRDVNDFLTKNCAILERNEVINTFPLWITNDVAKADSVPDTQVQQTYGAVFEGDQLLYVLVYAYNNIYAGWTEYGQMYNNDWKPDLNMALLNLLQQSPNYVQARTLHGYSPFIERVYTLLERLITSNSQPSAHKLDISTITPPPQTQVTRVSKVWSYHVTSKQDIQWSVRMRQMEKRSTLRLATWMDYLLLVKWSEGFVRDCNLSDGNMWDLCASDIKKGYPYLWCLDGAPTAMIWKRRALRHGISLGYVYTPKEHRQRGYASTMVAQFTEYLLEKEGFSYVTLFAIGDRDQAKNMYTSVGYKLIGSVLRYFFDEAT